MKYVTYDYEEAYAPPDPRNFWHIYGTDEAPEEVFDEGSILICGPQTDEMRAKIVAICEAIDAAIETALVLRP